MTRPILIDSLEDPRVDVYRDVRDKDLRSGHGRLFMAESELVIRRLLRTPDRIHSLLLSPHMFERMTDVLTDLPAGIPAYVAEQDLMNDIAGFHIHRGALAAGYRPSAQDLSFDHALGHLRGRDRLCIVLAEGMTNVDNMGGLFRNAAAFGVDGIVLDPTCCDPLYRKAVRVSMGHVLSVPYAVCVGWPDDLDRLRTEWGISLIAAEIAAGAQPLWTMTREERVGVVFGSEGHGLSAEVREKCDATYFVPMKQGVPSLNVATASGVFLYEIFRARS